MSISMKPIVHLSLLSFCFLLLAEKLVAAESAKKPNIIVFLTDDHGYADLGCQGILDDIKTPHADRLAASGVRPPWSRSAFSAPVCFTATA